MNPSKSECMKRASEILTIAYATALYAPIDEAVEKAVRAGGPSREEIRAHLEELRYGKKAS